MNHRDAIARVQSVQNGATVRGTAFLVTPSFALTALHVVADRKQLPLSLPRDPVTLIFPSETVQATIVDGMWDALSDWVLLQCERPLPFAPIPIGELTPDEHESRWMTFGFPDAKPDGLAFSGIVRDANGKFQSAAALQLYSAEAAAGQGAPVAGLSGAPCIVDGAVVGVLRSALIWDRMSVAGTLFATPAATIVAHAYPRLPLPDPYRGLPGLPPRPLPAKPYRSLHHYEAEHAEVFFGRGASLHKLYEKLTVDGDAPVTLVYGQSGVGKSSLIEAGLLPRLSWTHHVQRIGPDAATTLSAQLADVAARDLPRGQVIVVLDQVEELWTRPRRDPVEELDDMIASIQALQQRDSTRIVLSLRKEWLAELESSLEGRVHYVRHFVDRLTRGDVREVVYGVERNSRLRRYYPAVIEAGLGDQIASDLLSDYGSAVAPMLQIWMAKLWEAAPVDGDARHLTIAAYQLLKREIVHLHDFLNAQLRDLPKSCEPFVDSGLVNDVLEWHTTTRGTADTRKWPDTRARYEHVAPAGLSLLLNELGTRYVLTEPSQPHDVDPRQTRLAHDTLAPVVLDKYRTSQAEGQRARRLIEAKSGGSDAAPFTDGDLKTIDSGRGGMRAWTDEERGPIDASRLVQHRKRRERQIARWGAALLVLLVLAAIAFGYRQRLLTERDRHAAAAMAINTAVADLTAREPGRTRDRAHLALDPHRLFPNADATQRLAQAMSEESHFLDRFTLPGDFAWVSPDGSAAVTWTLKGGMLRVFRLRDGGGDEQWSTSVTNGGGAGVPYGAAVSNSGDLVVIGYFSGNRSDRLLIVQRGPDTKINVLLDKDSGNQRFDFDGFRLGPHGTYLWTVADNGQAAFIYDVARRRQIPVLPVEGVKYIHDVHVDESSQQAVVLGDDGSIGGSPNQDKRPQIAVYALPSGAVIKVIPYPHPQAYAAAFAPGGDIILAFDRADRDVVYRRIAAWKSEKPVVKEGSQLFVKARGLPRVVGFLPNTDVMILGSKLLPRYQPMYDRSTPFLTCIDDWRPRPDGDCCSRDVPTTVCQISAVGPDIDADTNSGNIISVGIAADRIVTTDMGGHVTVWEANGRYGWRHLRFDYGIDSWTLNKDELFAAQLKTPIGQKTTTVEIVSVSNWRDIVPKTSTRFNLPPNLDDRPPAFSSDGRFVANLEAEGSNAGQDRLVRLYDVQSRKAIRTLRFRDKTQQVSASPDGGIRTPRLTDLQFAPDAGDLIATNEEGTAWVWTNVRGEGGDVIAREHQLGRYIRLVQFSPDGSTLATAAARMISLWKDWRSSKMTPVAEMVVTTGDDETADVSSIAFDSSSKIVAASSGDGLVKIWDDWEDGTPNLLRTLVMGKNPSSNTPARVQSIAFHPRERVLAVWSRLALAVYDLDLQHPWVSILYDTTLQSSGTIRFSHDGKYVIGVNSHQNGYVYWTWRPEDLVTEACDSFIFSGLPDDEWTRLVGTGPRESPCGQLR